MQRVYKKFTYLFNLALEGTHSFSAPPFNRLAWIAFYLIFAIVFYSDSSRWINPIGEKDMPSWAPGQNDFSYPYVGARALLEGINPYHNDLPEFTAKYFSIKKINGVDYKQIYPP